MNLYDPEFYKLYKETLVKRDTLEKPKNGFCSYLVPKDKSVSGKAFYCGELCSSGKKGVYKFCKLHMNLEDTIDSLAEKYFL